MQLENISVTIRPRNPWEAMDLGLVLVRQWWKAVFIPWFLVSAAIFIALNIIFREQLWLALLVFWLLKPFYDRLLLSVFSQSLFSEPPTLRETLGKIPGLFKTGLFINLTLLRINVFRSFHLPVWQLEGLRGKERRERIKVVGGRTGSHAFALTFTCIFFEMIIWVLLIGLIALFTPEESDFSMLDSLFTETPSTWMDVLDNFSSYLAILIIEPIYVAAGFMLYINRRTQLEGWDIELAFRRMSHRLQQLLSASVTTLLMLLCLTPVLIPSPAYAETKEDPPVASVRLPGDRAKETVEKIFERDEFNQVQTKELWLPKIKDDEDEDEEDIDNTTWETLESFFKGLAEIAQWVAVSFRALLWLLLIVLIALLIIYRDRWLWLFTRQKKTVSAYTPPEQLFGLEISPESLPDDIAAAAREKILAGEYRDALGLLYRGALSVLIRQDNVEVQESHTEGDVLTLAGQQIQPLRQKYLAALTRQWQQIAYAHRQPEQTASLQLCELWKSFEVSRSENP